MSAQQASALESAIAWLRGHPDFAVELARAERAGYAPLDAAAAVPFIRTEVVRPAALRAWLDRIDETRRALAAGRPIDVLLLGAGPTNAALCLALERARPDLAIVVVDRGAPGGPFARAGAGFRLNTWSAPGPMGMSLLDEVDLHAGLAISPALLSAARFPAGDTLADATLLTWIASGCGAVAGDVTAVAVEGERVAFTVAGDGGEGRVVSGAAAVLAAGFGSEPRHSFDDDGRAFVAAEAARPIEARRALDAEALFAYAAAAGIAIFDGDDLAVVGAGPSALGVLALACGLGPAELTDAPGRFSRWRARPRLTWITGEHGPASAREARQLWETEHDGSPVRPGTMSYVIAQGAATLLHELIVLEDVGRLTVVAGRAGTLGPEGDGIRLVVGARAIRARRAVLCTGYRPRIAELLRQPGGAAPGSLAELLASGAAAVTYATLGGVREPIAITLAGERVHVIGAATEEAVAPDLTRPPFAEAAARAIAVADQLARSLPPGHLAHAAIEGAVTGARGTGSAWLRVPPEAAGRPWDRLLAPLDVLLAVATLRMPGGPCTISLELEVIGDELVLRADGVDDHTAAWIASRLPQRLIACAGRHRRIAFAIDLGSDGRVIPASVREGQDRRQV